MKTASASLHSASLLSTSLLLALNEARADLAVGAPIALALAEAGKAPDWVQIMPAGPDLRGVDGRAWRMADPAAVVAQTKLPFALDYLHAMDLPDVGVAPIASGWCEQLDIRDGQIWGRVDWSPKAAAHIAAREFRFISPGFTFRADTNDVVALESASLVNRPNFVMQALNSRTETSMLKDILIALGLPETATAADAAKEITRQRDEHRVALNAAQTPSLDKFAPRADFDAAVARANNAEQKLTDLAKKAHDDKVAAAIGGALKTGKITPASRDYHLANCASEAGLAAFEKFVEGQKSHFDGSGLDKKDPNEGTATALNEREKTVCIALGLSEKDYLAAKALEAA